MTKSTTTDAEPEPQPKSKAAAKRRPAPKAGAGVEPDADAGSASSLIDARIAELGDWRGPTLARVRALILEAEPAMVEEWKWRVPVWSCAGIVCTGEAYKKAVKLTFAKGASIADPSRLFNASLEGNTRRAIDLAEGADIDEKAFRTLVQAAAAFNRSTAR